VHKTNNARTSPHSKIYKLSKYIHAYTMSTDFVEKVTKTVIKKE